MKHFELARALTADELISKGDVFSRIWHGVFKRAEVEATSDIHVETFAGLLRVRMRKHGDLMVATEITDTDLLGQLLVRIKEIAGLDVSTREEVQDGAFELSTFGSRYRVALVPGAFGETLVFRVIREGDLPRLDACHLSAAAEQDLRWALAQEKGFICITGPTGSGKSTTLQACLMEMDLVRQKIITLEDPIERRMPGIIQQQIGSRLTWAKGIKAAMRQDPDVILIGEIRDPESAALALQAAQTGHLVLSTLHTNDVPGIVSRLLGLGVDRQVLSENLLYISAQRLVPLLCQGCKQPNGGGRFNRGIGCSACGGLGLAGRIPIIEYSLAPSPQSILCFSNEQFAKDELKLTLVHEMQKLVSDGRAEASSARGSVY